MITIIAFGKWKEDFCKEGFYEYFKRLEKMIPVKFLEIKNQKKALSKTKGKIFLLDENGQSITSPELAGMIKEDITFIIGDAYGFSDEIKNAADGMISLSKMIFPHLFCRMMLSEQLYRAATINSGHPYHHK